MPAITTTTYQADLFIVARTVGASGSITIEERASDPIGHGVIQIDTILNRLGDVAWPNQTINADTADECWRHAAERVPDVLGASYSVERTPATQGHVWVDGSWVPTNQSPKGFGFGFPLLHDGDEVVRDFSVRGFGGVVEYLVVVQQH